MKFKSQICTNVIQSQRLIELGLRKEQNPLYDTVISLIEQLIEENHFNKNI